MWLTICVVKSLVKGAKVRKKSRRMGEGPKTLGNHDERRWVIMTKHAIMKNDALVKPNYWNF